MLYLLEYPAELVLEIFSSLSVRDLCSLSLVSREWKQFLDTHESFIFHNASLVHCFVFSWETPLQEATAGYGRRSLVDVQGWKDFCRQRFLLEKNWLGRGPSSVNECTTTGTTVHRFKVDEAAGYIICTSQNGGISVTDFPQGGTLWSLPEDYVRPYAHCEYSEGFLVFDRYGTSKEVWRRTCDYNPEHIPATSFPDPEQIRASAECSIRHISYSNRGHFTPWALLQMPTLTLAFRFVFPTLAVVASDEVYIWDIPTAQLSQTIRGIQVVNTGGELGDIRYVEVNEGHVFICGSNQFRVFSRDDGTLAFTIGLPLDLETCGNWEVSSEVTRLTISQDVVPGAALQTIPTTVSRVPPDCHPVRLCSFQAVHVSPTGSVVVVVHSRGMIIIRDFHKILKKELALPEVTFAVDIGSSPKCMAFEGDRIVASHLDGIYIFNLQPHKDCIGPMHRTPQGALPDSMFPHISTGRAVGFIDYRALRFLSCLQITDTRLFFTWDPDAPKFYSPTYTYSGYPTLATQLYNMFASGDDSPDFMDSEEEDVVDLSGSDDEEGALDIPLSTVFCIDFAPL